MLFEHCTDVACNNIFAWLNQGSLTLAIVMHIVIILPMIWIYFSEKKRLEK